MIWCSFPQYSTFFFVSSAEIQAILISISESDSGPKPEKWTIATLFGPQRAALTFIEGYGETAEALRLLADYVLGRVG